MPIEDRLGMITEAFGEEFVAPVKIQVRQVGSIKPVTKEQAWKRFKQFSATEQKEMALELLQEVPEKQLAPKYLKLLQSSKQQGATTPVQIHTLQISRKQEGSSPTRTRALKTKPITKEQFKKGVSCRDLKEQKEIFLKALEGIPNNQLTPKLWKLRQGTKPVVMGNLSVANNKPKT